MQRKLERDRNEFKIITRIASWSAAAAWNHSRLSAYNKLKNLPKKKRLQTAENKELKKTKFV